MDVRSIDLSSSRDIEASLELFRLVYGRPLSEEFYRWRFVNNPFGPPMVSLLWDGNVLAGHYAVAPTRALFEGRTILAGQSMTTMTHPTYRNRGAFTTLASHLYEHMANLGAELVWGLPNNQSHYGFVRKLKWIDSGIVATMTCVLPGTHSSTAIDEERGFSGAVGLFDARPKDRNFPSLKDEAYFHWRYLEHPDVSYRFFSRPSEAFIVTKDYPTKEGPALELVDYVYQDPAAFGRLVDDVIGWADQRSYKLVRTWMGLTDDAFPELEKMGFAPRVPLAYFAGRALGSLTMSTDSWDIRRWCVTMGNSDNY